jgi:hypothetical protein
MAVGPTLSVDVCAGASATAIRQTPAAAARRTHRVAVESWFFIVELLQN